MAERISASEASNHFLNSLDPDKARDERALVDRFVEWLGEDRAMNDTAGEDITGLAWRAGGAATATGRSRAALASSARPALRRRPRSDVPIHREWGTEYPECE